jgi:hypothetical protein
LRLLTIHFVKVKWYLWITSSIKVLMNTDDDDDDDDEYKPVWPQGCGRPLRKPRCIHINRTHPLLRLMCQLVLVDQFLKVLTNTKGVKEHRILDDDDDDDEYKPVWPQGCGRPLQEVRDVFTSIITVCSENHIPLRH